MTDDSVVEFRLYVARDLPNSQRAIAALETYCQAHLASQCRIEIVDVFENPHRALADKILLTPQLVMIRNGKVQKVVGDLQDQSVLQGVVFHSSGSK